MTAARFALYFINPKHTLYPSVTPPPPGLAHAERGTQHNPLNLFGWSICHQKWHRLRTRERQTNTKSHGGLSASSVRQKQKESQKCPNKALIVPRAQRENSVNPYNVPKGERGLSSGFQHSILSCRKKMSRRQSKTQFTRSTATVTQYDKNTSQETRPDL